VREEEVEEEEGEDERGWRKKETKNVEVILTVKLCVREREDRREKNMSAKYERKI
jgi:hypothetical protein